MSGRTSDSRRMTSAPRCARFSVQNGPAQAQDRSMTRIPSSGLLAGCSDGLSGTMAASFAKSELCSPNNGGGRTSEALPERVRTGAASCSLVPVAECSTLWKNCRSTVCGFWCKSAKLITGAKQIRRRWPSWKRSCAVCLAMNSPMSA